FNNEVNHVFSNVNWYFTDGYEEDLEDMSYIYYISDGERALSNTDDFSREDFIQYGDAFFEYDDGAVQDVNTNYLHHIWFTAEENMTIYIAFSDEYMEEQQVNWTSDREVLTSMTITFLICATGALALVIYLITVTGRKPNINELQRNWIDSIYTEILLVTIFGLVFSGGLFGSGIYSYMHTIDFGEPLKIRSTYMYPMTIVTAFVLGLSGIILLSLVRKIKDKRFFKDFLVYRIFYKVFSFVKSFFDGRRYAKYPLTKNLHQRQLAFIVASFILTLLTFMLMWTPL